MNQTLEQIPIKDIVLSGDNQRRIDEQAESFAELKASIAGGGLRVPIQVRIVPDRKTVKSYELRDGERRFRACKALGLQTIPAIVHSELTDDLAFDLTAIPNKFREDLKPMEEAAEAALWMQRTGGNAKAIAERTGMLEKRVRMLANIHGHLTKCWREIFEHLDKYLMFQNWTVTHLSLLSRLPEHIQVDLHKHLKGHWTPYFEKAWGCSVKDLEEIIGMSLHLLSKAKWSPQGLSPSSPRLYRNTESSDL